MLLATTDPGIAISILDAIASAGVEFAVLHGESSVADGQATSDVDIVADRPASETLRAIVRQLEKLGLAPIMVWPYDVGGTASIFFAVRDASAGAQIDICYDPEARGQYGLRTEAALHHTIPGERWKRLSAAHETAYRIRKRAGKRQTDELARIVAELDDSDQIVHAAKEIFTSEGSDVVRRSCIDPASAGVGVTKPRKRGRFVDRLRFPVGFAIALHGGMTEQVEAISQRFSAILPHVSVHEIPKKASKRLLLYATELGPMRWRAGLVIAVGQHGSSFPFDYRADVASVSPSNVTASMSARVMKRLG